MRGIVMAMPQRDDTTNTSTDDLVQLHKLADAGDADALYRLGMRYARGDGVVKNHEGTSSREKAGLRVGCETAGGSATQW